MAVETRCKKKRKKKEQRGDKREEVKTQNSFMCMKNSSEKLSNQVVTEN